LIVSEGLLAYLTEEECRSLGRGISPFLRAFNTGFWTSVAGAYEDAPEKMGAQMIQAPLRFAPERGPEFFIFPHGWKFVRADSVFKTAARSQATSALDCGSLPSSPTRGEFRPNRPWSAACVI